MKLLKWLTAAAALLTFGAGPAMAVDKAKQAEVMKAGGAALEAFYKADPKIKGQIAAAPGYAVFSTYGMSFLVGGAGGKGYVRDFATKKVTFMDMALASAGLQIGASETRYLFIFKDKAQMQQFIDKGWDASANIAASAGTGTKSDGGSVGAFTGGQFYQLTKTGLQMGAAAQGVKVWKDKELN
jgi:lipid-binding SYLF domain-containing protein